MTKIINFLSEQCKIIKNKSTIILIIQFEIFLFVVDRSYRQLLLTTFLRKVLTRIFLKNVALINVINSDIKVKYSPEEEW